MSRLVDVLQRWGRRGAERLAASDDRPVALASTLVGAAAVWYALPHASAPDDTAVGELLVARHFWPVGGAAAVLSVVPKRWHYGLQSLALAVLYVTYQLEEPGGFAKNAVTVAMWAASVLLVWRMPLKNERFRKGLIVLVTLSLPFLARSISFEQGVVLIQFLFACGVVAQRESRSFLECQRATSALRVMMPPSDLIAARRSGASILLGAGLIAGALLGFRAFDRVAACGSSPYFFCAQSLSLSIADEVWSRPRLASLVWAAVRDVVWVANFALQYSILTGLLNFLGIPMRFITGNMLRVRTLFDYWKIANRWQYELLRTVYLDNFFAIGRGWSAALGIVLVFLVSGLHHLPGRVPSTGSLASTVAGSEMRWLVFGALCAASYQWRVYSVRRRLRASLSGAKPAGSDKILATVLAAPLLIAVLSVSGLTIAGDEAFGAARPYWIVSSEGPQGFRKPQFYKSLEYGGPTRPAERIEGATTHASPAIAGLGGALYAAWNETHTTHIRWAKLRSGVWTASQTLEGAATNASPALATLGRRLFVAWRGVAPDTSIRWASFEDGGWSTGKPIDGAHASGPPSLAALGDRLYAAWRRGEPDAAIVWTFFDGSGWATPQRLDEDAPGEAPALAAFDGRIHAVWRGAGRDNRTLWWTSLDDTWAPPQPIPGAAASSGAAVAALNGRLEVAWRGVGLDADIQWATFDGAWAPPARTGLSTCDRPAMTSYQGYGVFAWRGREANRCDEPSDYGGLWDVASVYFVDIPRWSSDPNETSGRIVWRNLRTTAPRSAATFYRDVVGWRASGDGDYLRLAGARGDFGSIAPISEEERERGILPHWAPTIAVSDVDATIRKASSTGGRVYADRKTTPDNVPFAVIGDPTGAYIDVSGIIGAATLHDSSAPGDFSGTLLTTPDRDAALRFYGELFDWRAPEAGTESPEAIIKLWRGRTLVGAMKVASAPPVSWWLFFAEVDDLDEAVRRAVSGGGTVRVEPTALPDGARVAVLLDPQGAPFGLRRAGGDAE